MQIYGISNTRGMGQTVRLGEGLPDLLVLGYRGEILPVFGVEAKLRAFGHAHPALKAVGSGSFEPALLGDTYFEVAEKISAVVEAGEVETVVFDPVLDTDGAWIGEAFSLRAESFCAFMTTVADIARRQEGVPADRRPSPKALRKASIWYTLRMLLYRLHLLRHFDSLRRILGLKD